MAVEGEAGIKLSFPGAPKALMRRLHIEIRSTTDRTKQPIRTLYLGHVTGYQPIRDQYLPLFDVTLGSLPVEDQSFIFSDRNLTALPKVRCLDILQLQFGTFLTEYLG